MDIEAFLEGNIKLEQDLPDTKRVSAQTWFHSTSESAVDSILNNGFKLTSGTKQKLGQGVYLKRDKATDFGDTLLSVEVSGKFIDLSDDRLGNKWVELKKQIGNNPKKIRSDLLDMYPDSCGLILNNTMVVYKPDNCINDVRVDD